MSEKQKPKPDLTPMAERIRELREKSGLSQEGLARAIDAKSSSDVSRWERGLVAPSAANLDALSRVFRVTIDYIVKGEPSPGVEAAGQRLQEFLRTTFGQEAVKHGWVDELRRLNPPRGTEDALYRNAVLLLLERQAEKSS